MKQMPKNDNGEVMTMAELAQELIDYLVSVELISQKMAEHMSYKSMAGYTQDYFTKNMGVLAAMKDFNEEKWNVIRSKITEERYSWLFGKNNKPDPMG